MKITMFSPEGSRARFLDLATPLETYHFLNNSLYENSYLQSKELQGQIPGFGHLS